MSTLLDRIIDGATGDASIDQLLRQLKVLASRTATPALETWVEHELNGYPKDVDLPPYRGPFVIRPLGKFLGPPILGSYSNVEIPPSTFPEDLRESTLFRQTFFESISSIERWATEEFATFGWPEDALVMYAQLSRAGRIKSIMPDYALVEVRYYIGQTTFTEILGNVRSKVLDLALALERVAPLAGEREAPADQTVPAAQVINNHFHAPSNVAIGGDATQIVLDVPAQGDAAGLLRYLAAQGMSTNSLADLETQLDADQAADSDDIPAQAKWSRTRAWLARAASETTSSALGGAIVAAAESFLS